MSAAIMESNNNNNFSNWPKKTRGICKPKTTKNTSSSISCSDSLLSPDYFGTSIFIPTKK
ncbi:hypothetical protein Glove_567g24 [Diversispora epigaea]|uniref:Uncharacterized protein n=1 Tax=Diversispora epigaea TaxID=1348612 RepID=A0A397GIB0_9GLOM|nr:hypothetical protein Glove_567g24 [Diversispora epigaea]